MSGEYEFAGVYFSSMLVSALLALAATYAVTRVLGRVGAYRHLWHPALFDAAVFVILWAVLVSLSSQVPS